MKYKIIFILFLSVSQVFSQFFEMNSGVTVHLNSSSNCKTGLGYWGGWACGVNGTIVKGIASPSGSWTNWRNLTGHGVPTNINLTNICATDTSNAFVCGTSGSITYVWKTSNGGANWFQAFTQTNGFINAVWMKNSVQGIMEGNPVGGRWSLWKTTNGGINWDSSGLYLPQSGSETGFPNSLCMALNQYGNNQDSNRVWFGTNNARVYYSSNYGQNWTTLATPSQQNSLCLMFYREYPNPLLYSGGSSNLLKSSNFGTNWVVDSLPGTGSVVGLSCSYGQFIAVRGNKMYVNNFGGNWYLTITAPNGNYTYMDNRGGDAWYDHYATRDNGGITFFALGEGIKKISIEIPKSFSLSQNFPNPFNPVTKITFDIPAKSVGQTFLSVYDIIGREVAILINEKLGPGTYEAEWDASKYPSGVYFYKLNAGDFSETKRMVLIK